MNTYQDFLQPPPENQRHIVDPSSISNNINSDNRNQPSRVVPLKRTRAKRSCDFCRKRKSRCDADSTLPCSNCKAWGYSCEFQTVRKKRGPPSVYVDNLEKKCKKMESLLTALTKCSVKDLERNDYQYAGHTRPASPPTFQTDSSSDEEDDSDLDDYHSRQRIGTSKNYDSIRYTGHSSAGVRIFDNDIFESQTSIPWPGKDNIVLRLNSQDELMIVRTEKSSTAGISDTLLDVGLSMHTPMYDSVLKNSSITLSSSKNSKKPMKLELDKMIDLYFTHMHAMLPLIDKAKFLDQYQSSISSSSILVQAVLAVSFRFAGHNFPDMVVNALEFGDLYYAKVMKRLRESNRSRLCHVQASLLMTLYLDMDEGDVESIQWKTLGNAIRMAQDLGLHRSCARWTLPRSEIETRHRIFYTCYVLDRWLSARAGKPLTILDRDFDTDMPSPYEIVDENKDSESDPGLPIYRSFVCLIKLSEILGRILKSLYAPKAKFANANAGIDDPTILTVFDRRLQAWKLSLEEPLHGEYLSHQLKANLNVYYYTTILLLRRPFINLPSRMYPELQSIVIESENVCMEAAHHLSNIVQNIDKRSGDPACYYLFCAPSYFVYSLFQSSLVYLSNALKTRNPKDIYALHQSINLIKANCVGPAPRALETLHMLVTINGLHADLSSNYASSVPSRSDLHHSTTKAPPQIPLGTFNAENEVPKVEFNNHKMMNTSIIGGAVPEIQQQNLASQYSFIQNQQHQKQQQQHQQRHQHQQQRREQEQQTRGIQDFSTQEQQMQTSKCPPTPHSDFMPRQNYSLSNRSHPQQANSHHRSFSMGQMNSSQQHMYSNHTRSISHDDLAHMTNSSFNLQPSTNSASPIPINTNININHMLSQEYRSQYNGAIQPQPQQQGLLGSYTPSLAQVPQAYTAAYNPNTSVSDSTAPPSSLNWSDWDMYIGQHSNSQQQP